MTMNHCRDTDGDGIPDIYDPDDDNDGIPDYLDSDDDGDSIPDKYDPDQVDTDHDGIPDAADSDDDNDGIPDRDDPDDNGDGIADLFQARMGPIDKTIDSDRDGIPDYLDWDDDNDGIPDYLGTHVAYSCSQQLPDIKTTLSAIFSNYFAENYMFHSYNTRIKTACMWILYIGFCVLYFETLSISLFFW